MSDECARKHEIQKLCEACQVESEGAAGKFGVLPRETSPEAAALGEESAEVVVGGWTFLASELQEMERIRTAQGPKSQGDDLNPHSVSRRRLQKERAAGGRANRNGSPACGCPMVKPVKQPQPAPSRETGGRRKERNKRQV